jgi:hypothetical protein
LFNDPVVRKLIACDIARTEREWTFNGKSTYSLYQQYDYSDFYKDNVQEAKANGQAGASIYSFDQIIEEIRNGTFIKSAEDYQRATNKRRVLDTMSTPGTLA